MKQTKNPMGYMVISLSLNSRTHHALVHRLVALAFLENKENKRTVNHLDHTRDNNHYTNLEWATHWENTHHANLCGRVGRPVSAIMQFTKEGNHVKTHKSIQSAMLYLKKPYKKESLLHGKSAYGFFWILEKDYNPKIHTKTFICNKFVFVRKIGVEVTSPTGIITKFESMSDAAKSLSSYKFQHIMHIIFQSVRGREKNFNGYSFKPI